jgi:hypothetical protein
MSREVVYHQYNIGDLIERTAVLKTSKKNGIIFGIVTDINEKNSRQITIQWYLSGHINTMHYQLSELDYMTADVMRTDLRWKHYPANV